MSFVQTLTRFAGRTGLEISKKAPTAAIVVGVGALLASTILAVRATPKLDPIVEDLEVDLGYAEGELHEGLPPEQMEIVRRKAVAYKRFTIDFVRLYGPAIGTAALGIASIFWGTKTLNSRMAGVMAAYGILEGAFGAYRQQVRDDLGEDVDRRLINGQPVHPTGVTPEGKVKIVPTMEQNATEMGLKSQYAVYFDHTNPNWNEALPDWNLTFLRAQEKYANHRLASRGHLFLNEVYAAMGMPHTKAGAVVGWMYKGDGDGCVDFGLYEAGSPEEADYLYFFQGYDSILLDFNVDGVIYDKLP